MRQLKIWPVKILCQGCVGQLMGKPTPLSNYFILIAYHLKTESYVVWAEPDHVRALKRLHKLQRSIDPKRFDEVYEMLVDSHLPQETPTLKSIRMHGISAALFAEIHSQNSELRTQLLCAGFEDDYDFEAQGPPN